MVARDGETALATLQLTVFTLCLSLTVPILCVYVEP